MWKTKFCFHNLYLFGLFSLELLRRLVQTKVYYKLRYFVWKETSHKPLKVAAAKNLSRVCIILIQLASMNAFYYMWQLEDITFYTNLLLPRDLVKSPCCFILWNKCFERSPHFISVISTITLKCYQCQRSTTKFLLLKFIDIIFSLFHFVNVPHFF